MVSVLTGRPKWAVYGDYCLVPMAVMIKEALEVIRQVTSNRKLNQG
ncbi:MAG UNVERIFIED_CONTAM: hypothetical protein LVR29_18520 [Microcystis novacekii LVE1205-3]